MSRGDTEIGVDTAVVACDVVEFEESIAAGDHARALILYRGDLLDGIQVEGASAELDQWIDAERDRLRRMAAACASHLADAASSNRQYAEALQWARRASDLLPFGETAARRVIALLDRLGDRAGAVRAFDELAARLAASLEVDPAPETRALVDECAVATYRSPGGSQSPPATPTPVSPRRLTSLGQRSRRLRGDRRSVLRCAEASSAWLRERSCC